MIGASSVLAGFLQKIAQDPSKACILDRVMDLHVERLARNEAFFREVNERIRGVADQHGHDEHAYEFVCECADTGCLERLTLTLAEYERVRADATRFVLAEGHEMRAIEVVVGGDDDHIVVEKVGPAGVLAQRLDPRAA